LGKNINWSTFFSLKASFLIYASQDITGTLQLNMNRIKTIFV